MYSILPSFVLGFHGCDARVAEAVICNREPLRASANDYDWLGSGVYFWENNPQRALTYATMLRDHPQRAKQTVTEPAVIGAVIDLGYCLNLLDSKYLNMVKEMHGRLRATTEAVGIVLPTNQRVGSDQDLLLRRLDCAVINTLHDGRAVEGLRAFDTVRAAFIEGAPLYDGSGFSERNHIQVCVRSPSAIKGYFWPMPDADLAPIP